MKDIGVMIIDLELERSMIAKKDLWLIVSGIMELNVILMKNMKEMEANQWISESNIWNWVTIVYWKIEMFHCCIIWNQSKLAMNALY